MKAVTGIEMSSIDKFSIEKVGIPGIVLMENAALKIVKHIKMYFDDSDSKEKKVVIAAGKGNNAGDAFAVARHLIVAGYSVRIYCLFQKESVSGDAKLNLDILQNIGGDIEFLEETSELSDFITDICNAHIVIDGIFGTGFKGQVKGCAAKIIQIINNYSKHTIAIDIASGTEAATGKTADICIKAHKTITFELPKIGQLVYPGAAYAGDLIVESIGMPQQAIISVEITINLTDKEHVKTVIPQRKPEFNKGNCGKIAIVTGSAGMAGSGCICAKSCLRTGAGLVYVAAPSSIIHVYQSVVPEAVAVKLDDDNGIISVNNSTAITELFKKCNAAAIGPGLSSHNSIYNILSDISEYIKIPVVLDADALNALAENTETFNKFENDIVITPHPGEMARMTGLDVSYIQQNRIEVARKYAVLWGVVLVLKGAKTIIADKSGEIYINPTGNSGMATAGSGDALTGIIASLLGQGASSFEAATAGCYLHGLAGDIGAAAKCEYSLNALDIVEYLPNAFKDILK